VKAKDHNRQTARMYASSNGHAKVAELLEKHGAH